MSAYIIDFCIDGGNLFLKAVKNASFLKAKWEVSLIVLKSIFKFIFFKKYLYTVAFFCKTVDILD